MHVNGCDYRCITGIILAVIFGALFLWFLVQGFVLQTGGAAMLTAFLYYLATLILLVITKHLKYWASHCGCSCCITPETKTSKAVKKKI